MKQKLSITIEEDKIKLIEEMLKEGLFRSKSHVVEYSLSKFLKENNQGVESK
jgi:Arc/MetJ-type ribon-helix-helix transcriptional regulator